jgi:4-hydroxyphenylpyruvate dioxygenase-like putative hemolysin
MKKQNVNSLYSNAVTHGATSIQSPTRLYCENKDNYIEIATIKPPYGTWTISLIDRTHCPSDIFMPGFLPTKQFKEGTSKSEEDLVEFIDHIAFAVEKGKLLEIAEWYKKALGTQLCEIGLHNQKASRDSFLMMMTIK